MKQVGANAKEILQRGTTQDVENILYLTGISKTQGINGWPALYLLVNEAYPYGDFHGPKPQFLHLAMKTEEPH